MTISFIRIDDRIIHGQVVTRWSMEYPCDGILTVNDAAAESEIMRAALKSASEKKVFVYSLAQFLEKADQAIKSEKNYFLITKDPETMALLLVKNNISPNTKNINVGPQSARPGTFNVNMNADITPEDIKAFEQLHQHGYNIDFRLVPDSKSVLWSKVRDNLI